MIRFLLSVVMIAVLISPFSGGHALGHSSVEINGHAPHSHSASAQEKCERACDNEKSLPCCHDALMHCATYGVGMSSHNVTVPFGEIKVWVARADEVFDGLFSEAETPPPRI
jgi:hypothetical protein